MHVVTQIPAVSVWFGPRNSAHAPWPEQREKLAQEDQTGPAAGRRDASVDLSPVPTFMAALGCSPAAGLHLIGWGFRAGTWLEEGCGKGLQRLLGSPSAQWRWGEGRPGNRRKFRQHRSLGHWPLLGHKQELLAEQKLGWKKKCFWSCWVNLASLSAASSLTVISKWQWATSALSLEQHSLGQATG